ncbi:MAG: MBL fold metallo-hydrolase [bacterium]
MAELTFFGGVGTVTGANFLLNIYPTISNGRAGGLKILVDCGLVQGSQFADNLNRSEFAYNPAEVDYLLVTHAHIDHIGRIPKLVKDGFRGQIISTPETKEIAELLLLDTVKIIENEARNDGVLPIYEAADIAPTLALWDTLPYHTNKELKDNINIYFKDAGHILGSTMIEISRGGKKMVFTGDLGNSPSILLKDTEEITDADYILMESVYGDRNHEPKEERTKKLKQVILDIIKTKKTLIIPAFSLERTQMIIYEMNELFENGEIKTQVPVFLDSPLAIKVTAIYEKYTTDFNDNAKADIKTGDDIFKFPRLKFTVQAQESMAIDHMPNPKIIIAGSGMSVGGRVVLHEKHYVSNPNAEILFVGYQAAGSLGRQLQDGAKEVEIFGEKKEVRAKIDSIAGYSSHKDSDHLVEFVEKATESGKLKKVFCVMGEPKSSMFLVQKLRDNLGVDAVYPEFKQMVEIEL